MKNYILLADIINSTHKEPIVLMEKFRKTIKYINKKNKSSILSPLTITLGDEFQGIIDSLTNTVSLLFEIEEYFLAQQFDIKLRYVLYHGQIDTAINTKVAYEMLGEGLTNARKNLTEMKNNAQRFCFFLDSSQTDIEELLNGAFIIYQNIIDSWKFKNYKIAWEFISNKDYKIVAENVNLDKSSAWRRKNSLNINEYETIKTLILNILKNHDAQ